jgi:hypothetical protein
MPLVPFDLAGFDGRPVEQVRLPGGGLGPERSELRGLTGVEATRRAAVERDAGGSA